jgi:hypothetical protein
MLAADCELPGRGYPFHARFGGGDDKDSWLDFFRSLTGEPNWIVAGRAAGLSEAVGELWPDTILYSCEDEMREGLRRAARADRMPEVRPGRGPIYDEIGRAFRDLAHWQEFVEAVESLPRRDSRSLREWLDENEALVLPQFFYKRQYRNAPTTAEAVRPAIAQVRERVIPHAGAIRNLWRMNLRLALMSAHWSELDRKGEYVGALERHVAGSVKAAAARRETARPDWASGRDYGGSRSMDDFLAAAAARREAALEDRARRLAAGPAPCPVSRNAARVAVGLAPILPDVAGDTEVPGLRVAEAGIPVANSIENGPAGHGDREPGPQDRHRVPARRRGAVPARSHEGASSPPSRRATVARRRAERPTSIG